MVPDAARAGSEPTDGNGARMGTPDCRHRIANMTKKKYSRSLNDGKVWRCRCGNVNQPTKHRFFKLPALRCSKCKEELELNFKFCLGEITANGKSVTGEVWDQDKAPHCVSFAYGKTVEIMERAYNIRKGSDPDTVKPINPYDLEQMFDDKFSSVDSADSKLLKVGAHKVLHMGLLLRSKGVQRRKSNDKYIAADVSTIPRDDFEEICHCLAEGIPLVATYWAGKRRSKLRYCQWYKSPPVERYSKNTVRIGHAVVLIGAGIKEGQQFFYFLNSWGKKFCPRKNKSGETVSGGIGKIQPDNLSKNVVRLSYPNESGGERSLEDQSRVAISERNYLLMMAKANQWSAQKLQNAREKNSGTVSLDEGIINDDDIFSDDEGGYSQTSCAIHQGCGASLCTFLRFRRLCQYQQQSSLVVPSTHAQDHICSHDPAVNSLNNSMLNHEVVDESLPVHGWKELLKAGVVHLFPKGIIKAIRSVNSRPATIQMPPEVYRASLLACPAKVADSKLKVEEEKMKALPLNLTDSRNRATPKQEEMTTTKGTQTVAATKKETRRGLLQRATRLLKRRLGSRNETGA